MKAGAIGFKTKVIVGDAATLYLAEKIARQFGAGVTEAPIDGNQYARKDADWEIVESSASQVQSDLTEINNTLPSFVLGKEEFKQEILADIVIPTQQYVYSEDRQNLAWHKGWIKIPSALTTINQSEIKNVVLIANFGTGTTLLNCIISYPSRNEYNVTQYQGFYIKDTENLLNENSDFSHIKLFYDIVLDNVARFNGTTFKIGGNVIFDEYLGYHSTAAVQTFDKVYPTFVGNKVETVNDVLTGNASLEYNYTQTYCKIKEANIISRPYLHAATSENVASNPNILTVASHYGNTFERRDITSGAGVFLQNVIAVGARRNSTTDHTGASSYGYGVEFFEMAGKQEMNDNYNGAGDIWFPDGGYNVYQQSPTCAIVSAKFRQIQDATKASWGICRKAARATASNNGIWDMYRGFGIINVAAAIQYIEDNYINNDEYRAYLADKIAGENEKYSYIKYSDLDENSPLPKRESDIEYAKTIHDHSGQVINPDAVNITKTYTDAEIAALPANTLFWDNAKQTYSFKTADGGTIQINQEPHDYYTNLEGAQIVEMDVVSSCGASGNRTAICLTDATDNVKSKNCIGMVTVQTIGANQGGRITKSGGKVHGNTDVVGWVEGDTLWVDPANKGKLTNIEPTAGYNKVKVGILSVKHHVNGVIELAIHVESKLSSLADVNGTEPTTGSILVYNQALGVHDFTSKVSDFAKITGDSFTGAINEYKGSTVVSASNIDLTDSGNYCEISGIETINTITSLQAGSRRSVKFQSELILTNSTGLILPSSVNILTEANDIAEFISEGGGVWRLVNYTRNTDGYTAYTPTITGYSTPPPIATGGARYKFIGHKTIHLIISPATTGTSNATTKTITLPFPASSTGVQYLIGSGKNNSADCVVAMRTRIGSNIADLFVTFISGWTASGSSSFVFNGILEIN